jgi:hypothetical protein
MRILFSKYKWLLVVELICLLLAILPCFKPEKKVFETTGEDMGTIVYDAEGNGFHYGEIMTLTPGVYQVRAVAQIPSEQYLAFEVCTHTGTFQALRGNKVKMYAGQEYIDFEIYVSDTVDTAYFLTEFSKGTANAALQSLTLYRTAYGGRILFTLVLLFSLVLNFILIFRQKILLGKINKASQIAFWVLAASTALAYFPYFTDYMTFGADSAFHLLRIEGLKETLLSGGQFPVRMQSYWLADHGYPVSMFYGDLFLYFPALLRLIGFSLMTSYKIFIFALLAATAAIAYYSFKICTKSTYAALFGSMIYVLAPYGIYNLINRGAVGELLGMTFLPLVCCGFYMLYTLPLNSPEYTQAKYLLVLGLSGILNSHFLTTEIVLVFLIIIAVIFAKRTFRQKTICQLLQAAVMCLSLNAFFWVPFLIMLSKDQYVLNNLIFNSIQNRGIYPAEIFQLFLNMGAAQTAMYHAEPIQLGGALFVLLLTFILLICFKYATGRKGENEYEKPALVLWVITLVTVFMGTRYFPWDLLSQIPGVKYLVTALQFPTRFFSPASALGAFFAVYFVMWLIREGKSPMMTKGILMFIAVIAIFSAAYHVNDIAYERSPTRLYSAENMGQISVGAGEYLLREINWYEAGDLYTYHKPVAEEGLNYTDYYKKGTNISIHVQNTQDTQRYLEIPLISYPGYGISCIPDDDTTSDTPIISLQNGSHEDLRIAIPDSWSGTIRIRYKGFLLFRVAELVTLFTILGLLLSYFYRRKNKFRGLPGIIEKDQKREK